MQVPYTPEPKSRTKAEHEAIMQAELRDLNPSDFLYRWKEEQKFAGVTGTGKKIRAGTELMYEIYEYQRMLKGKAVSGNQLVKAARAEGESCSNERAKVLAPQFEIRWLEENNAN